MEKLTGIRKLYRKGNGQGKDYRARLNGWSYAEAQRQIEYKAKWEGLRVVYVNPWGTSSHCATCGSKVLESTERMVYCPQCRTLVDRDANAARNVASRGVRFAPFAPSSEAMNQSKDEESMTVSYPEEVTEPSRENCLITPPR